jgi:uncharacterized ferredoxin-like protein
MEGITQMDLGVAALGCILVSISLHYKKENESLRYGSTWGFAQNLTVKGRIMFLIGLAAALYPCIT